MGKPTHTVGSLAFAEVVRRHGAAEVARKLARTPGAVSNWAAARRSPSVEVRADIASAYDVPVEAWDQQGAPGSVASPTAPSSVPQEEPERSAPAPVAAVAPASPEALEEVPEASRVVIEQLA